VVGNHEMMVLGTLAMETANESARAAIRYTRERIAPDQAAWVNDLPLRLDVGDAAFFHAFPEAAQGYINEPALAEKAMAQLDRERTDWAIAFHGHTHKQRVFERGDRGVRLVRFGEGRVDLAPGARYLVCPGSVGVSRDADPRAAYLIYDSAGTLEQRRVDYDWQATEARIAEAGLTTRVFRTAPAPAPGLARRMARLAARALGRP